MNTSYQLGELLSARLLVLANKYKITPAEALTRLLSLAFSLDDDMTNDGYLVRTVMRRQTRDWDWREYLASGRK